MISVAEALEQLFALVPAPQPEEVPLREAAGRVLLQEAIAQRDQPPFDASAMDGYAVCATTTGDQLTVIGESAAGHRFDGTVSPGQAVRIFTGAPVPAGATAILIQEDTQRDGDVITVLEAAAPGTYIRKRGGDFHAGQTVSAPRLLRPSDVALLAAMNVPRVTVAKRPEIVLISTGDELVMPGETPGPDQIIVSNTFGLEAQLRLLGARVRVLPIAKDTPASLCAVLGMAEGADLVITIGGASVGDHDLVAQVAAEMGLERAFHKVAMRPGKPLMSGRLGSAMMIGLPGNPVSAMVCGQVFVAPVVRAMTGLAAAPAPRQWAPLAAAIPANGPREHYMRARRTPEGLRVYDRQDSSLLGVLAEADALVVRPPHDGPRNAGEQIEFLPL